MSEHSSSIEHWMQQVRSGEPGRRFERLYQRRNRGNEGSRLFVAAVGALLVVAGAVMLLVPGPGLLVLALGALLLAQQSHRAAQFFDNCERWGRAMFWRAKERWDALGDER